MSETSMKVAPAPSGLMRIALVCALFLGSLAFSPVCMADSKGAARRAVALRHSAEGICSWFLARRASASFQLQVGDAVDINADSLQALGTPLQALFLGKVEDTLYFFQAKTKSLFKQSFQSLRFENADGTARDPHGSVSIQELPTIQKQDGPSCAVHSTYNCLKYLNERSLLESRDLKVLMDTRPEEVFHYLDETVSALSWRQRRQRYEASKPRKGFFGEIWHDIWNAPPSQSTIRQAIFRGNGIRFREARKASELAEHLRSGRPAIIDLEVAFETRPITDLETGEMTEATELVPAGPSNSAGAHSVLALHSIKTGLFSSGVLVLDSYSGLPSVWDEAAIQRARKTHTAAVITLVAPSGQ